MARIAGVNLPVNKRALVSLTYIHGIGPKYAMDILKANSLDPTKRIKDFSEDEISMAELAKRIANLVEQETGQTVSVDFSEGYPGDSKRRLPNLFQAENTLQWKAETSLEDGLLQTLRSML